MKSVSEGHLLWRHPLEVLVYGKDPLPEAVKRIKKRVHLTTEADLYAAVHERTGHGGTYLILITSHLDEDLALSAARLAHPRPDVVIMTGKEARLVTAKGCSTPYNFPAN